MFGIIKTKNRRLTTITSIATAVAIFFIAYIDSFSLNWFIFALILFLFQFAYSYANFTKSLARLKLIAIFWLLATLLMIISLIVLSTGEFLYLIIYFIATDFITAFLAIKVIEKTNPTNINLPKEIIEEAREAVKKDMSNAKIQEILKKYNGSDTDIQKLYEYFLYFIPHRISTLIHDKLLLEVFFGFKKSGRYTEQEIYKNLSLLALEKQKVEKEGLGKQFNIYKKITMKIFTLKKPLKISLITLSILAILFIGITIYLKEYRLRYCKNVAALYPKVSSVNRYNNILEEPLRIQEKYLNEYRYCMKRPLIDFIIQ